MRYVSFCVSRNSSHCTKNDEAAQPSCTEPEMPMQWQRQTDDRMEIFRGKEKEKKKDKKRKIRGEAEERSPRSSGSRFFEIRFRDNDVTMFSLDDTSDPASASFFVPRRGSRPEQRRSAISRPLLQPRFNLPPLLFASHVSARFNDMQFCNVPLPSPWVGKLYKPSVYNWPG